MAAKSPEALDLVVTLPLFHSACQNGNLRLVNDFLSRGVSPDVCDSRGQVALHKAARGGQATIAAVLIEAGATVNARDNNGETPLHAAMNGASGSVTLVELLMSNGADVSITNKDGRNVLHVAAAGNQFRLVELLLGSSATSGLLNSKDSAGATPLMLAAAAPSDESCRLLLAHRAMPAVFDRMERHALHYAAATGCPASLRLLLDTEHGRGPPATERADTEGNTALALAAAAVRADNV
jgi:ankyrin repeat protein